MTSHRPTELSTVEGSIQDRWRYLGRLLRLLWTLSPGAMMVNAGVTLLIGLAPLATLMALRHLVDAAVQTTSREAVGETLLWTAALVGARALEQTCWTLGSQVRNQIQERLRAQIQERVLGKAQALPLLAFEQPEVFDQLQRIERGVDDRLFSTMAFIFQLGNNLITLTALLLYAGAAHWALPAVLAVGSFISLLFRLRLSRERFLIERKQTEPQRRLDYLGALMTGREAAAEIRLFGLRSYLLSSWERLALRLRDERLGLARREFRLEGATSCGQSLTLGLGLLLVVALITRGALSVGQYAAFVAAVQGLQDSLWAILWDGALVDNDLRYIRDFFLYLDLPEERRSTGEEIHRPLATLARDAEDLEGTQRGKASYPQMTQRSTDEEEIGSSHLRPSASSADTLSSAPSLRPSAVLCASSEASGESSQDPSVGDPRSAVVLFERVRFRYPGSERFVLDGVDLEIRSGERIALVGENGAGKTTLARLLLRLYPPSEGRVLVDGVDLSEIDPATWWRRSAAVFQDFQQYQVTLRENIALGDLERATSAAIERAAALSGAAELADNLPKGYDTLLGKAFEDGTDLSLGQWQKIAVARAYLRDAEVLVLDEPTAALDAKAEVEVYRQFRDVSEGKTVLLISHRLGSARLADRILVLADGRITEEGTHAELMARDGIYAKMLGAQAAWYA